MGNLRHSHQSRQKSLNRFGAKDSLNNNCYDSAGFRGLIV
jgi:hypothetical protein